MAKKSASTDNENHEPHAWVVDWQNKNPSVIVDISLPKDQRKPIKLVGDEAKFGWIDEDVHEGDTLYTELGASADIISYIALKKGVKVLRIKTHILKDWRRERDLTNLDTFESLVYHAENFPSLFLETPPAIAEVLALKCVVRHFENTQEMRKSEALRLSAVATMEFFLQRDNPKNTPSEERSEEIKKLDTDLQNILTKAKNDLVDRVKTFGLPMTLRRKF
ncbi:MAG: hypothetical protein NUV81_03540, partial [bacterium]|nr:hypothetical protein [bacterium]